MRNKPRGRYQTSKVIAIVPAAGIGKRFGREENKPLYPLIDMPLLIWPLKVFQYVEAISEIILVVKKQDIKTVAQLLDKFAISKVCAIVAGGRERQDSVFKGLKSVKKKTGIILIHDGARPLIQKELIESMINGVEGFDGAIAAIPVKDTIKEMVRPLISQDNSDISRIVLKTLDRSMLWAVQTPQVFRYDKIMEAHERARRENYYATDDAALVERYGGNVRLMLGSCHNIKITTPDDIFIAEALIRSCGLA
jgi:2-C-methyl-D-erythritol 4-phosphate cytidylyltransferase